MTSLDAFPRFEALTRAEASVFEEIADSRTFAAGSDVPPDETLLLVEEGSLSLTVESSGATHSLGELEPGGLLGERRLFEVEPTPIRVEARVDTTCLSWTLADLKGGFRYSRTGAAKLMAIFARSLSQKIRWANAALLAAPSGASGELQRPAELDTLDLERLRSIAVSRSYDPETRIFEEGGNGGALFVIAEGEVEIEKRLDSGGTLTLAHLGPGDFFGEMAFVDESPRSAAAVAKTRLKVQVLPAGSLEKLLGYNVGTALYVTNVLCKIMTRRLNATLANIRNLTTS